MRTSVAILVLLMLGNCAKGEAMPEDHPVPKDRAGLKDGQWFPYTLSKLAPLEWWSYEESTSDVKRENYPGGLSFQRALQNTWEFPRFCFSLFRPYAESFKALLRAVNEYQGAVTWQMHDNCIAAWPWKPASVGLTRVLPGEQKLAESLRNPPRSDAAFVKKAVADIPVFCAYLEQRLGLIERVATDFDSRWLTAEGLAKSKGEFEDFLEWGDWTVFLARDPSAYAHTFQPTSTVDRDLSIEIGFTQAEELLKELGGKWEPQDDGTTNQLVLPNFPMLSRLSDIPDDVIYEPDEVATLFAEILRAQQVVKERRSIRALDSLIRVARWAERLNVGIYFGGQ